MRHILAIDEGTTGSTSLVVGEDGRVAGRGYREITQHFPRPGWVEHDANEIGSGHVTIGCRPSAGWMGPGGEHRFILGEQSGD